MYINVGCIQYYTSPQAHLLTAHVMLRTCDWPMSVNPGVEKNAYCFFTPVTNEHRDSPHAFISLTASHTEC